MAASVKMYFQVILCLVSVSQVWSGVCMIGATAGCATLTVGYVACMSAAFTACSAATVGYCFHDNTTIDSVVETDDCLSTDPPTNDCIVTKPVHSIMPGETVLTLGSDGSLVRTRVLHNKRHIGMAAHIKVSVMDGDHHRNITVTENHVMMVYDDEGFSHERLLQAKDLMVGHFLRIRGSDSAGLVQHLERIVVDHKNELGTEEGTVLANNIQVTTICSDFADLKGEANTILTSWRKSHSGIPS